MVFENPALAAQAQLIEKNLPHARPRTRLLRHFGSRQVPVSFGQEQLWFLEELGVEAGTYNVVSGVRLRGELKEEALERALGEMVRRHEVLRTVYRWDGERVVKGVREGLKNEQSREDLRERSREERAGRVRGARRGSGDARLRPGTGPDVAGVAVAVGQGGMGDVGEPASHCDGRLVVGGLVGGAERAVRGVLRGPGFGTRRAGGAVWRLRDLAAGAADGIGTGRAAGVLEGGAGWGAAAGVGDGPAQAWVQSYRGGRCEFELGAEVASGVRELSREEGATAYMTLLAGFVTLLYRYTGQEDFGVGMPVANRERPEVEGLIGFFVNTLVVRTKLGGEESFRELVGAVKEKVLAAQEQKRCRSRRWWRY